MLVIAAISYIMFSTSIGSILSLHDDPPIQKKIQNIKLFTNISDEDILLDPSTFIIEHGDKPGLRISPKFFDPKALDTKRKALDLMKQAIYGTQTRLRDLDHILEKYKNNPAMKMAFLFGRLKQLIIDIRRIYTLALKHRSKKKVYDHIILYHFATRKHIDVIYLVEHVIDFHKAVMAIYREQPPEYR